MCFHYVCRTVPLLFVSPTELMIRPRSDRCQLLNRLTVGALEKAAWDRDWKWRGIKLQLSPKNFPRISLLFFLLAFASYLLLLVPTLNTILTSIDDPRIRLRGSCITLHFLNLTISRMILNQPIRAHRDLDSAQKSLVVGRRGDSSDMAPSPLSSPAAASDQSSQIDPLLQTSRQSSASSSHHDEAENRTSPRPSANLTFVNGLAIVIGLQIGSGVFSAPSQVSNHVDSPGAGVLVWLIGGLLVWTGAASFIELGLAIPANGGVQEYLHAAYGDFPAFLFTWSWVGISKPAAMAMIAMVFADHFCFAIFGDVKISLWASKSIALLGLAGITVLNCCGTRTGPRVANGFLVLKVLAVSSISLTGLSLLILGKANAASEADFGWFHGVRGSGDRQGKHFWAWLGEFVTAMYGALFCFGGWETVSHFPR